jgi:hypothetical protein
LKKKVWKADNVLSSDNEEAEEDRSRRSSKITPRPLTLPHRFKVEPSDSVLSLVLFDSDPTIYRPRSSSHGSDDSESSDDSPPAWPAAFYVVDIVRGFEKCDEAHREHRSVEKAFFKCFKVPFRSTTFYNHHRNWDNASASSRDAALRAGRTSAGLWTTFLKRNRAKAVKSVDKTRKRKKRVSN